MLQVNIANSMMRVTFRKRELHGLLAEFARLGSHQHISAALVTRARRYTCHHDDLLTHDDESRVEARGLAPYPCFAFCAGLFEVVLAYVKWSRVQQRRSSELIAVQKAKQLTSVAPEPCPSD